MIVVFFFYRYFINGSNSIECNIHMLSVWYFVFFYIDNFFFFSSLNCYLYCVFLKDVGELTEVATPLLNNVSNSTVGPPAYTASASEVVAIGVVLSWHPIVYKSLCRMKS